MLNPLCSSAIIVALEGFSSFRWGDLYVPALIPLCISSSLTSGATFRSWLKMLLSARRPGARHKRHFFQIDEQIARPGLDQLIGLLLWKASYVLESMLPTTCMTETGDFPCSSVTVISIGSSSAQIAASLQAFWRAHKPDARGPCRPRSRQ